VALADGLELPVPAAAAVAGDVTTAYTLYARTGLSSREPVVVLGTNPIARFLVEILRTKGITPTVIVDGDSGSNAAWQDWLLAKGAAAVTGGDPSALRATVTAAISAQGQGARPWRLIVTDARELPRAALLAGPRATLTVLTTGETPAVPGDLIAREVAILGVAGPHPDLVVEAAALCVKGEIDLVGGVSVGDATDPTRAQVIAHDVPTSGG
jgi:threonine dehydrogenase-like Zn-dependent dehydrogenase